MVAIWNTVLFYPFLNLLLAIYHIFGNNLGWAVIVLAIIIRLALIPSTKSQTEMTRKMASLKPELDKLQKKYANNQKKLVEEQTKLYKKVGYNPIGCIGSLVPQLLVLYVMLQVINVVTGNHFDGIYPFIKDFVFGSGPLEINKFFFGLDLSIAFNNLVGSHGYFSLTVLPYLLLALSVGFVQFLSTKFMQVMQGSAQSTAKKKDGEKTPEEMQSQMMNSMNAIFPLMTVFVSLSTPAVLGVYWLAQSVMLIVQYFITDYKKSVEVLKSMNPFKKK